LKGYIGDYPLEFGKIGSAQRFAELSLEEQIACVRQTSSVLYKDYSEPLRPEDVDPSELEIVLKLLRVPLITDIWMNTFYGNPDTWESSNDKFRSLLETAVKKELWWKYIGLSERNDSAISSAMYSIRWVIEQRHSNRFNLETFADHSPSYQSAIGSDKFGSVLALGAISMVSVLALSSIHQRFLEGSEIFLIDVNSEFVQPIAEKCGMDFSRENALDIGSERTGMHDLIITHRLVHMLEPTQRLRKLPDYRLRRKLFGQCYDALAEDGRLVMVEHYFSDNDSKYEVKGDLEEVGFSEVSVVPVSHFSARSDALEFMRTGEIVNVEIVDPDYRMHMLVANK
jgi:hypothetical protein